MACELLIWPIQTHKYLVNITSGQYHASGPKTLKRGTEILQKRSLRRFANGGGGGGLGVGQQYQHRFRENYRSSNQEAEVISYRAKGD